MKIDTKQLRGLLAKATPGEWKIERQSERVTGIGDIYPDHDHWAGVCLSGSDEDFELIAALRNAAPALLDELDRLRGALERVVAISEHAASCRSLNDTPLSRPHSACNCFLSVARAALSKDAT